MSGRREALAANLAAVLGREGLNEEAASLIAVQAVARVEFDATGMPIDLGAAVHAAREANADILATYEEPAPAATPGVRNPWLAATSNLTQRILLQKENPTLAARLRAEAGIVR